MRPPAFAALLLVACDLEGLPDDTDTPSEPPPASGCVDEGWVRASEADLFINTLAVDGVGLVAGVDPAATYDGVPSVCVDPAGGGVDFVFEVGDEPFGRVRMVTTKTGSLVPVQDGTIEVELFAANPPVTFGTAEWALFDGWEVSSLAPFQTMLTNLQGQGDGRFLTLSLTASVAP